MVGSATGGMNHGVEANAPSPLPNATQTNIIDIAKKSLKAAPSSTSSKLVSAARVSTPSFSSKDVAIGSDNAPIVHLPHLLGAIDLTRLSDALKSPSGSRFKIDGHTFSIKDIQQAVKERLAVCNENEDEATSLNVALKTLEDKLKPTIAEKVSDCAKGLFVAFAKQAGMKAAAAAVKTKHAGQAFSTGVLRLGGLLRMNDFNGNQAKLRKILSSKAQADGKFAEELKTSCGDPTPEMHASAKALASFIDKRTASGLGQSTNFIKRFEALGKGWKGGTSAASNQLLKIALKKGKFKDAKAIIQYGLFRSLSKDTLFKLCGPKSPFTLEQKKELLTEVYKKAGGIGDVDLKIKAYQELQALPGDVTDTIEKDPVIQAFQGKVPTFEDKALYSQIVHAACRSGSAEVLKALAPTNPKDPAQLKAFNEALKQQDVSKRPVLSYISASTARALDEHMGLLPGARGSVTNAWKFHQEAMKKASKTAYTTGMVLGKTLGVIGAVVVAAGSHGAAHGAVHQSLIASLEGKIEGATLQNVPVFLGIAAGAGFVKAINRLYRMSSAKRKYQSPDISFASANVDLTKLKEPKTSWQEKVSILKSVQPNSEGKYPDEFGKFIKKALEQDSTASSGEKITLTKILMKAASQEHALIKSVPLDVALLPNKARERVLKTLKAFPNNELDLRNSALSSLEKIGIEEKIAHAIKNNDNPSLKALLPKLLEKNLDKTAHKWVSRAIANLDKNGNIDSEAAKDFLKKVLTRSQDGGLVAAAAEQCLQLGAHEVLHEWLKLSNQSPESNARAKAAFVLQNPSFKWDATKLGMDEKNYKDKSIGQQKIAYLEGLRLEKEDFGASDARTGQMLIHAAIASDDAELLRWTNNKMLEHFPEGLTPVLRTLKSVSGLVPALYQRFQNARGQLQPVTDFLSMPDRNGKKAIESMSITLAMKMDALYGIAPSSPTSFTQNALRASKEFRKVLAIDGAVVVPVKVLLNLAVDEKAENKVVDTVMEVAHKQGSKIAGYAAGVGLQTTLGIGILIGGCLMAHTIGIPIDQLIDYGMEQAFYGQTRHAPTSQQLQAREKWAELEQSVRKEIFDKTKKSFTPKLQALAKERLKKSASAEQVQKTNDETTNLFKGINDATDLNGYLRAVDLAFKELKIPRKERMELMRQVGVDYELAGKDKFNETPKVESVTRKSIDGG